MKEQLRSGIRSRTERVPQWGAGCPRSRDRHTGVQHALNGAQLYMKQRQKIWFVFVLECDFYVVDDGAVQVDAASTDVRHDVMTSATRTHRIRRVASIRTKRDGGFTLS